MTPLRIISHGIMLLAVAMISYPLLLMFAIVFIFLFERPYDVLLWAIVADVLYSPSFGYGIHFSVFVTMVLILSVSMLAKRQLLFRGY
jgi:hypothetical protein